MGTGMKTRIAVLAILAASAAHASCPNPLIKHPVHKHPLPICQCAELPSSPLLMLPPSTPEPSLDLIPVQPLLYYVFPDLAGLDVPTITDSLLVIGDASFIPPPSLTSVPPLGGGYHRPPSTTMRAPEVSTDGLPNAVTLLLGMICVIRSRKRA